MLKKLERFGKHRNCMFFWVNKDEKWLLSIFLFHLNNLVPRVPLALWDGKRRDPGNDVVT